MADFDLEGTILTSVPDSVRKHIQYLCLQTSLGLLPVKLGDITPICSDYYREDDGKNITYHFLIKISYAGRNLKWDVIFDPEDINFTPDFDFNDDEFLPNPDYNFVARKCPNFADWNLENPRALSAVLNEFLYLYKEYQVSKLRKNLIFSKYFEEYEELVTGKGGVEADNVEVYVDYNNLIFFIGIEVDESNLPEYNQPRSIENTKEWYNPGVHDRALLKITISGLYSKRATLQLTARLGQVLGKFQNIPEYTQETTLINYFSQIKNYIRDKVNEIIENFELKRNFVINLLAICNESVTEWDNERFSCASFLRKHQERVFFINIFIGEKFPVESVKIRVSLVNCADEGETFKEESKFFYKTVNSNEENVKRILEIIDNTYDYVNN